MAQHTNSYPIEPIGTIDVNDNIGHNNCSIPTMSHYVFTEKFRKLNILSHSANTVLILLFLLMTVGAGAQIAELSTAAKGVDFAIKAADLASTKDFIWLILVICASLAWIIFFLVKAIIDLTKNNTDAAVKTAQAVQRLCDVIEDRTPLKK